MTMEEEIKTYVIGNGVSGLLTGRLSEIMEAMERVGITPVDQLREVTPEEVARLRSAPIPTNIYPLRSFDEPYTPSTANPKSSTPDPPPQTQAPSPQPRNPKPETLIRNPNPSTAPRQRCQYLCYASAF